MELVTNKLIGIFIDMYINYKTNFKYFEAINFLQSLSTVITRIAYLFNEETHFSKRLKRYDYFSIT